MGKEASYALQQFLNLAQLASFYAPLAVAFALIHAITKRVFLSFGDFAMFGSFAAVYVCFGRLLQGDPDPVAALLALLVAMACAAALGQSAARHVFAPMMQKSALAFMIASIGFSIFIAELMRISTDSRDIWIPPLLPGQYIAIVDGSFPVRLTATNACAFLVSVLALLMLWAGLRLTRFGRNWQACSQNLQLAQLCGVNTGTVILQSFILGTGLSAVSGWTSAIIYGGTNSSVGIMLGFKAMFAAVAGGFGNVKGAFYGALFLSTVEVLWSAAFGTTYRDVGVFSIIILVLVLKPEGLVGTLNYRESEP